MRALKLWCPLLLLSGCGTDRIIDRPVTVEVVKREYVAVPADLVSEVPPVVIPDGVTYGELIELHARDRAIIYRLNGKLRGIAALGAGDVAADDAE